MSFEFDLAWDASAEPIPEVKATSARLSIRVNGRSLTRAEDVFARTVTENVRVATYPLALWLASNWWRLRWESPPEAKPQSALDWRMSHEMPAIGYGYLWPPAALTSDGQSISVRISRAQRTRTNDPIRYLEEFTEECPASEFERAADRFVDLVLTRLADCSLPGTELKEVWTALRAERDDPQASRRRSVEARLGLDPDEDPAVVQRFLSFEPTCGRPALDELAAGHSGDSRLEYFSRIAQLAQTPSHEGAFVSVSGGIPSSVITPWDRGRTMARMVRDQAGLDGAPLSNLKLGELLGLVASVFQGISVAGRAPSVAIPRGDAFRFVFQKSHEASRRFEAARLLGDHLLSRDTTGWRVAADTKTYRQRSQRAFAAELLAPVEAITERLAGDLESDRIEQVAGEFQVSPFLVASQLANHGLIDPGQVPVAT